MYGREQRVLLRHYLEQGLSKTEIARQLGVSLRTSTTGLTQGNSIAHGITSHCGTGAAHRFRTRLISSAASSRHAWRNTRD